MHTSPTLFRPATLLLGLSLLFSPATSQPANAQRNSRPGSRTPARPTSPPPKPPQPRIVPKPVPAPAPPAPVVAPPPPAPNVKPLADAELRDEIARRAFEYFWTQADDGTGLVSERAFNREMKTERNASVAATGYALAALPIGVERRWISREQAENRALITLRFLTLAAPQEHGYFYRSVTKEAGERSENSELSPLDTAQLVAGALVCGEYLGGETRRLANALYTRVDWKWMLTNDGQQPDKNLIARSYTPENGFSPWNYDKYAEASLILLLGLGAPERAKALPTAAWDAPERAAVEYAGLRALDGGPLATHQMPQLYFDLRGKRDRLNFDYGVSLTNNTLINRRFCADNAPARKSYAGGVWGLSASDSPAGFQAYGAPQGPEDGTVASNAALASMPWTPVQSTAVAATLYERYGRYLWGRYGFGNAFNVDGKWFDGEVIGTDLGMALLALENDRSGLIWKLMQRHNLTEQAYKAAGLRDTREIEPRPLQLASRSERTGKWITNETGEGAEKRLIIVYFQDGDYPQIGNINFSTGVMHLNYGIGGSQGAGIALMPAYWSEGKYWPSAPVKIKTRTDGDELVLSVKGQAGQLEVSVTVSLRPPHEKLLTAAVEAELRGEPVLDKRAGEAFKPVQLLFNYQSRDEWDARQAFAGDQVLPIPADGWIVDPERDLRESRFGVLGGNNAVNSGLPTIRVEMEKPLTIAGQLDRKSAADVPNSALWAASDALLHKYRYQLVVTSVEEVRG